MGRPSLKIDEVQLRKLWIELKTSTRIAKELGCHPQTVKNYTKKFGITGLSCGYKKGASPRWAAFGYFLQDYQDILPKKMTEMARISGCTYSQVVNYMYRIRKDSKELLSVQPWRHTGPPVLWEDISGVLIPDKAFDVVRAHISRFGSIKFNIRLKTKVVHVFKMTHSEFRDLYK